MKTLTLLSALLLSIPLTASCGGTSAVETPFITGSNATSLAPGTTATAESSDSATGTTTDPASSAGASTFTLDENQSVALYRARETLASIGSPTEAVGKTSQVSGSIVFTDSGIVDSSASKITIDLSTLQSDKSQRDNYIKRNTLQADQFPDAVFVPTEIQGLNWPLPTSGQAKFTIVGDLTVHEVTSRTPWDATATFGPDQIQGTATTAVKFEDFGMKPPKTFLVISVEDNLTLELDFVFTQGG